MKIFSMNGLKRAGAGVQILLIAGVAGTSCKEDLDEARSALAAATKERDALSARLAVLEHELATTRAELARQRPHRPTGGAALDTVASNPVTATTGTAPALPVTPASAVAGEGDAADRSHLEVVPPPPLTTKERARPRS